GFEGINIKVGRFDLLPGLERATSSNWITAIERSAIYELASWAQEKSGYGIQASTTYDDLVYTNVGLFRQDANEDENTGRGKNTFLRSEERRVGKECRYRRSRHQETKNERHA